MIPHRSAAVVAWERKPTPASNVGSWGFSSPRLRADAAETMWLDVVAFVILGSFAWMGARKGALAAGMGLLALVAGYGAALYAGPALGPAISRSLGSPEWAAFAIAGSAGFAVVFLGVAIVARLLRPKDAPDGPRTPRDRFLGGAFGAARGAILVVLISYLALWADAGRVAGAFEAAPEVEGSAAAAVTEAIVEAGVKAALADAGPAGRVVARIAARPSATLGDLQELLESPQISAIREDSGFWSNVEAGSIEAAMNRTPFLALSHDPALREQLAALGLVDAEAAADADAFRAAAGEVLTEVGLRIRGLRDDPELQALMDDPQVVAMVQSGDTLGLLIHPGFRQLVSRVSEAPVAR